MPEVAAEYFGAAQLRRRPNPKVEIRIDDGRHLLATTAERFDAITSDPLDPWVKGAAALYTREFWELCKDAARRRRRRDGVRAALRDHRGRRAQRARDVPRRVSQRRRVREHRRRHGLRRRARRPQRATSRSTSRASRGASTSSDYERVASSLRAVGFDSALDLMSTFAADARIAGTVARRRRAATPIATCGCSISRVRG